MTPILEKSMFPLITIRLTLLLAALLSLPPISFVAALMFLGIRAVDDCRRSGACAVRRMPGSTYPRPRQTAVASARPRIAHRRGLNADRNQPFPGFEILLTSRTRVITLLSPE